MTTVATADVFVGERYRRDLGDLELLADSIREVGLLHPIVVTSDGRLVTGVRRLRACRDVLGWEEIPARVVDECPPDAGELHENEARKNLAPSERVGASRSAAQRPQYKFVLWSISRKKSDDRGRRSKVSRREAQSEAACFRFSKLMGRPRFGVPELVSAMDKRRRVDARRGRGDRGAAGGPAAGDRGSSRAREKRRGAAVAARRA